MLAGPFSQRVLLTLEEKKVPYEVKLVDLGNKPEWSVSLPLSPFRRLLLLYIFFPQEHSAVLHAVSHNRLAKRRSRRVFFFNNNNIFSAVLSSFPETRGSVTSLW